MCDVAALFVSNELNINLISTDILSLANPIILPPPLPSPPHCPVFSRYFALRVESLRILVFG